MNIESVRNVEPLKLVPFNQAWIGHDKIDIHAIYRRPRFVEDEFGEKHREYVDGQPTWDITTPLPVKQHNRWLAKGFEYITLADRESLAKAGAFGTIEGNWRQYDQHQTGGPWNYKRYLAGQLVETSREVEQLRADVERFGSEVVEHIRRGMDPTFRLPDSLRNVPAGGKVKAAAVSPKETAKEAPASAFTGGKPLGKVE